MGVTCQGTPPKQQAVQQTTLLSPEPYQTVRQQQIAQGQPASYNLPSPSVGVQQVGGGGGRPCYSAGGESVGSAPQQNSLMPCMIQQQRSPSVAKTPTTPVCPFPGQMDEAFSSPAPSVEPCSSNMAPVDPSPPPTPNSLMKLQQLTRGISMEASPASVGDTYTTQSSSLARGNDTFAPPQNAVRRQRYSCSAVPERPASVQPAAMNNVDSYPHMSSTPPAGPLDPGTRSAYYPAGIVDRRASRYDRDPRGDSSSNLNYGRRAVPSGARRWHHRNPAMNRQHSVPACMTGYEHSDWPGNFDNYPGYGHQAHSCQMPPHYPFNCAQAPGYMPGTSGSFQHGGAAMPNSVLMPPTGQATFQAPNTEHYARVRSYGTLGIRAPFSGHDVGPDLSYPPSSPYGAYIGGQGPGYPGNSFPYR